MFLHFYLALSTIISRYVYLIMSIRAGIVERHQAALNMIYKWSSTLKHRWWSCASQVRCCVALMSVILLSEIISLRWVAAVMENWFAELLAELIINWPSICLDYLLNWINLASMTRVEWLYEILESWWPPLSWNQSKLLMEIPFSKNKKKLHLSFSTGNDRLRCSCCWQQVRISVIFHI